MPLNKSGLYFYLDYSERVTFKILNIGIEKSERGRLVRQLAVPHFIHISRTPFFGTNRKTMGCGGPGRCELCQAGLKPATMYRVKIMLIGEPYEDQAGLIKTYDMPASCHSALADKIQQLFHEGKEEDDILDTVFELERLPSGQRPFFVCRVNKSVEEVILDDDEKIISEDDHKLLTKLSATMQKGAYKNTAQAMTNTLRKTYGWSDFKIDLAFETVLDENGFYRADI